MRNILLCITLLLTTSCMERYSQALNAAQQSRQVKGSKNYVTRNFPVGNFDKVKLSGSGTVYYTQQSGKPKVEACTSDNIMDLLDIKVKEGTLNIGFKKNASVSAKKLDIRVSSPELTDIKVSGSGTVNLTNDVRTDNMKMSVSGSGDIKGEKLRCERLETRISGSGDIVLSDMECTSVNSNISGSGGMHLAGTAQECAYKVGGSGDINAASLRSGTTTAHVSGSGQIKCHANRTLEATVSGSGKVVYDGNPATLKASGKKGSIRSL